MNDHSRPLSRNDAAVLWALGSFVYATYNGVSLPIKPLGNSPPLPHTEHESFSCRILEDPDATFHRYPDDEIPQAPACAGEPGSHTTDMAPTIVVRECFVHLNPPELVCNPPTNS